VATTTFIGRQEELAKLADAIAAGRRAVSAAIVEGEPGSGKSRLVREAAGAAAGVRRLDVVGYEPERSIPFAAAASLLRALAAESPPLRELLDRTDRAVEPVRLFEAALRAFRDDRATLLLIDDLQWCDSASVALSTTSCGARQRTRCPSLSSPLHARRARRTRSPTRSPACWARTASRESR
jgi:predicted ATPase